MARIAGINIPQNKLVHIGLTYIYGIGDKFSQQICKSNVDKFVLWNVYTCDTSHNFCDKLCLLYKKISQSQRLKHL